MSRSVAAWASIGVALVVALFFVMSYNHEPAPKGSDASMRSVSMAGQEFYVTIAATDEDRERGLGGRTSLAPDEGMLFVFDTDLRPSFWMKGMLFSIDILWLASDGTIVYVVPDLSPDTYPQTYAPQKPSRYVLELPAGTVAKYNVHVGDIVEL